MAPTGLAVVLFVVLAASLTAHDATTGQVVITVIDPSGAVISGARIGIIQLPSDLPDDGDWLHYALTAPNPVLIPANYEEATFTLAKGRYAVSITAYGFKLYSQKIEIQDALSQSLRATLALAPHNGREDCMTCGGKGPEIPLEPTSANIFIPLEPLQTMAPTTTRVLRR
jgi:hypothetical protein